MTNPFHKLIEDGNGKAPLNVEQASALCDFFEHKLSVIAREGGMSGSVSEQVWADQTQLAARFGYKSSAEMSRVLSRASEAGFNIKMFPCGNGKSKYRYKIADVENYLMNRKVADQCK